MNSKPRVLLLSASSGAGHVRAAQALEKAFAARGDCAVEHIDTIEYVSKLFQRVYDKAYISMVRRAPELMGVLYDRLDEPWHHPRRRLAMDRLNTGPMIRMLKRVQPDLCVATHFLAAEIVAWLIAKRKLRAHNAIVVTDYDRSSCWQSWRPHHVRSSGARVANGAYRADPGTGRTQCRSFTGGGRRYSL
jgi:processive 1,2-diacylglycerol beta-glucosyltransferase